MQIYEKTNTLPEIFRTRLAAIIPQPLLNQVMMSFVQPRPMSVRHNTLKADAVDIQSQLKEENINFKIVDWCPQALVFDGSSAQNVNQSARITDGRLYQQSLSSMFVSCALDPKPRDKVLDLCAAPGSKSSHMAALMNNQGTLVCVEKVPQRCYRLKSVLALLGVKNAQVICKDGRRFQPAKDGLFDKVLVDAPCSSEGRFHVDDEKSYAYWSLRKIKEMAQKQKGLLLQAGRCLKQDGELIYATCTFAPEENEAVVDWFLRKAENEFELLPVDCPFPTYPAVLEWGKKKFNPALKHCVRILPDEMMDGFFIAKLRKTSTERKPS